MTVTILVGDVRDRLKALPDNSVQCVVTSPPYFSLRSYLPAGHTDKHREIGSEPTLAEYIETMVAVFREVRRVLHPTGVCFLNLGSSYGPNKCDLMVPARVALALIDDNWILRSHIIWHKKAPMPESVTDRPTSAHESIFLLTKSARYYWDAEAVREEATNGERFHGAYAGSGRNDQSRNERDDAENQTDGRNLRNVWTLGPDPFSGWTSVARQRRVSWDAADDDTMRTPSPDCPVHVWSGQSDPIRVGDERGGDALIHTAYTDDHPAPTQAGGSVPTDQNRGVEIPGGSLDSLPRSYAQTAMPHSSETSRTDRDPVTTPPCTPSAQTIHRTDDTSTSPEIDGQRAHTIESSTSADSASGAWRSATAEQTSRRTAGTQTPAEPASVAATRDDEQRIDANNTSADSALRASCPSAETISRTTDMSTCTCSYHKTVTESISHFAVMPREIPRRCIKAGTSQYGVCGGLVTKLKLRDDLTDEQRAMVYARLGAKGIA